MTQGAGGRGGTADDLTPPGAPEAAGHLGAPGTPGAAGRAPVEAAPAVPRPALPPVFPPSAMGPAVHPSGVRPPTTPVVPGFGLGTPGAVGPTPEAGDEPAPAPRRHVVARGWRTTAIALGLVTVLLAAGSAYLWRTSDAWQQRAEDYEAAGRDLGVRLADERAALEATTADLEAVRDQLATAQTRIIELANEKAQIGDDREAQRMLVDYQERVSDAAGRVAKALDQCVQGQNRLIGYLRNAALYDPKDLDAYSTSVQDLCQQATDANSALQGELSR